MSDRKTTSIKVKPEVWKEAKKYAIDNDTTVGILVEQLLRKELGMELLPSGPLKGEGREVEGEGEEEVPEKESIEEEAEGEEEIWKISRG